MFEDDITRQSNRAQVQRKIYLGDGAYVAFDGYSLVLTAENGIRATDTVVLEPGMFVMLLRYAQQVYPEITAIQTAEGKAV